MDELNLHKGPVIVIVCAQNNPSQLFSVNEDSNVIMSILHNE